MYIIECKCNKTIWGLEGEEIKRIEELAIEELNEFKLMMFVELVISGEFLENVSIETFYTPIPSGAAQCSVSAG